jgi:hypothetical protein
MKSVPQKKGEKLKTKHIEQIASMPNTNATDTKAEGQPAAEESKQ